MSSLKARRDARRPGKPRPVAIDFSCNDPDNGLFAHAVCQIQIPDSDGGTIELSAVNWSLLSFRGCPAFSHGDGHIRLSGRRWPIVGMTEWYGNWCWNRYRFAAARQFLTWLHAIGRFQCDAAPEEFFEAWRSSLPLFADRPYADGLWLSVAGTHG